MAKFKKAESGQAFLKMLIYGSAGDGKTLTSLLVAEQLAALGKGKIAFVDTEHGTDFYTKPALKRGVHPQAFVFDALYSRSLMEVLKEVTSLNLTEYKVIVLDSLTHLWEAAIAAYTGRQTKIGTIPMQAWSKIKKPYKDLMKFALDCPAHVIMCSREGHEYEESDSGELKRVGYKPKCEGETAYEPHVVVRMEKKRSPSGLQDTITARVEKDRTGSLTGSIIEWPTFETLAAPLLGLLGGTQVAMPNEEDAALQDAEMIARDDREREAVSRLTREKFESRFRLAASLKDLKAIGVELDAEKKKLLKDDIEIAKETYRKEHSRLATAASSDTAAS